MAQSLPTRSIDRAANHGGRGGALFLAIFALPFCGVGLFLLGSAVWRMLAGGPVAEHGVLAMVGLAFASAGFGLLFFARHVATEAARTQTLRARHPSEPWRWRPDWATGRIPASEGANAVAATVIALVWNAVSAPALLLAPREVARGDLVALVVLVFPAVGLGLAVWAARAVARRRRFGRCVLELATLPGVVGGPLRGTVHVPSAIRPEDDVAVTLVCVQRVTTGAGRSRSTREIELWRGEAPVPPARVMSAPVGSSFDVAFSVPGDARPSSPESSDDEIVWRLATSAALPGVDFQATFDVPVFRTDASDETLGVERAPAEAPALSATPVPIAPGSRITAAGIAGGVELRFPAARSPASAASLTVFALIWNGFLAFMASDAPGFALPFVVIFGGVGLVLVLGALDQWLGTIRLRVRGGEIEEHRRLLLLRWTRVHRRHEIEGLSVESTGHVGKTVLYGLALRRRGRKRAGTLVDGLGERATAERVLRLVEDALAR